MLNDFDFHSPIYIACGYTNLRRGIDGLSALCTLSFSGTHFRECYSCSVEEDKTELWVCTRKATDFCCYINGWRTAHSSGTKQRRGVTTDPHSNTDGKWRG